MKIKLIVLVWMLIAGCQTVLASAFEMLAGPIIPALRFETKGHLYFDEGDRRIIHTLGAQYQGKTTVMRFVSEDIHVMIKDPDSSGRKALFYHQVIDPQGMDITNQAVHLHPGRRPLSVEVAIREGVIISTGLPTGEYLLLNFYDRKTDTLLRSFCLIREKIHLQVTNEDIAGRNIELLPKEEKILRFARAKGSREPLYLSYRIKTRSGNLILEETSKDQITLNGLAAGKDYTLTVWSPFLPENEFSEQFHIYVRPNWYQTNLFYLLTIVILLLGLWAIFVQIMRRRVKIAENKRIETEQKLLSMQAQLNPHFVFNALNSIKGLNNTGQIEKANQYLGTFSTLLRNTLKNSSQISHSLEQELATLKIYLDLEKLRFGFHWTVQIADNINPSTLDMPTLLLQPLVENAIKHGVSALGTGGMVGIRAFSEESDLLIEILDNGKGFPDETDHQGFGIRLTRDRIQVFNSLSKENQILLTFEHHGGTIARLTFTNWLT